MSCEERLSAEVFYLEQRRLRGDLVALCTFLGSPAVVRQLDSMISVGLFQLICSILF